MEIGPFNVRDADNVKELLESKNIEFSILIDQEAEEAIRQDYDRKATKSPRAMAGQLDLKIVYFEISESDFEKVKNDMEKYGVAPLSDGSYELGED